MQEQLNTVNPLLESLRLPGETVRIPSRSVLYTEQQVDPQVIESGGELHVYPMTTYEEILMKTPDLLFSGQAIVQTFARCIPQIRNPLELFAKDVDFLLVVLRKATYGSSIDVRYKHTCADARTNTYSINVQEFLGRVKELDADNFASHNIMTLPNNQVVKIRPFLLKDVIAASQRAMAQQNIDEQTDMEFAENMRTTIIEGLSPAIVQVDNTTDRGFVKEWLDKLPAPWVDQISAFAENVNKFGIEFQSPVKCMDCGEELMLNVPLNPQSFFTQPFGQETRN